MWPGSEQQLREGPGGPAPDGPAPDGPAPLQQRPPADESERRERAEPVLVCAACGAPVTHPDAAIEVNGSHVHTFLNPAGEVYRIRCFGSAPGALPVGEESDYWTWFAGRRWQACICRACFEHLGWRFTGAGPPCFGLIHERIVAG